MASSEQSWCLCWRYLSTGFVFACSRSRPAVRSPFLCPPAGLRSRDLCPFSSSSRKVTFFVQTCCWILSMFRNVKITGL